MGASGFLQVFAQGVLELPGLEGVLADNRYILSSPGGGKTTLLNLFLPHNVVNLHRAPPTGYGREDIVEWAKRETVITADGANVAGLRLTCIGPLASVERLALPEAARERFFLAALNAKAVLDGLYAMQVVLELDEDAFLDRARLVLPADCRPPPGFPANATARAIRSWAERVEADCGEAIDAVLPLSAEAVPGHGEFLAPALLNPANWSFPDGKKLGNVLIMLDDVHFLPKEQLKTLYNEVFPKRTQGAKTWLAARTAIANKFDPTRDFRTERDGRRIVLEEAWANAEKAWPEFSAAIADKRATMSISRVASFSTNVEGTIEATLATAVADAIVSVRRRVEEMVPAPLFQELARRVNAQSSKWNELVTWRASEAQLQSRKGAKHQALTPRDTPAPGLEAIGPSLMNAAELFLHKEHKFPYYYGMRRLSGLGFYNAEQFLFLASPIYEYMLDRDAAGLASFDVPPVEQQRLVVSASRRFIKERLERLAEPNDVRNLINGMCHSLAEATYLASAPYAPGTCHVAIPEAEYQALSEPTPPRRDVREVRDVLNAAATENIVRMHPVPKVVKDRAWRFIQLNPLYGIESGLPVASAQCTHASVTDLAAWIDGSVQPRSRRSTKALGTGIDTSLALLEDFDEAD